MLMLTMCSRTSVQTFGVYLLIGIGIYYVRQTSASEACAAAWALTLIFSLAAYNFRNWPKWRSDENEEQIPMCVAGVLIVFGFKGFELLL